MLPNTELFDELATITKTGFFNSKSTCEEQRERIWYEMRCLQEEPRIKEEKIDWQEKGEDKGGWGHAGALTSLRLYPLSVIEELQENVKFKPEDLARPPQPGSSKPKNQPRRFNCEHPGCGQSFERRWKLKVHWRSHPGARPCRCTWPNCSWSFSRPDDLTRHYRTHTGYMHYRCGHCKRKFSRLDHSKLHVVHCRTAIAGASQNKVICNKVSQNKRTWNKPTQYKVTFYKAIQNKITCDKATQK